MSAGRSWLGEHEARRIARMLDALFLGRTREGEAFVVSGQRDADWLALTVGVHGAAGAFCYDVEARARRSRSEADDEQRKAVLLDLLGSLLDGYLVRGPRAPFTGVDWEPAMAQGLEVFLRGQERNPAAEREAAALLAADASRYGRAEALAWAALEAEREGDDAAPAAEATAAG